MPLTKLSQWFSRPKSDAARIPDGLRVYAIGDIHGRLDLFDRLLAQIQQDERARESAETHLLLLGDLIDRGPESAGVVQRAIELKQRLPNMRMLMGNHEEVFLRAVAGDVRATKLLTRIGGRSTILSYGVTEAEYGELEYPELTALLASRVPEEHAAFLGGFEDAIEIGDYLFVHAGIRPGVAIDDQKRSDLRWIRDEFLDHNGSHGCVVVHGHSITDDVDRQTNRIGIDTGAFATGRLTALGLEGEESWVLQT